MSERTPRARLYRKSARGFQGYPVGTVAFYGPDNQRHKARTVVVGPGILGCPHEEGVDYPDGGTCPACPYWAGRERPI